MIDRLALRHGLLLLGALVLTACSTVPPSNVKDNAQLTPTTSITRALTQLPEPRAKIAVAVYGLRDQTGQYRSSPDSPYSTSVTQGAATMLVDALLDSGWYIPVEREGLQNLLTERRIVRAIESPSDKGKPVINLPNLLPASLIIEGGIIAYESNVRTGGKGANFLGIGGDTQYRVDQVTVGLRSIDIRTGQILNTVSVTKTIYSYQFKANVYKFVAYQELLQGETGFTTNEPAQLAVKEAIEAAVVHLTIQGVRERILELKNEQDWNNPTIQSYLRENEKNQKGEDHADDEPIPMQPLNGENPPPTVHPLMAASSEALSARPAPDAGGAAAASEAATAPAPPPGQPASTPLHVPTPTPLSLLQAIAPTEKQVSGSAAAKNSSSQEIGAPFKLDTNVGNPEHNEREQARIQMLARDERHVGLLNAAAIDLEKKNTGAARAELSTVLRENPRNEKAQAMLRKIEEKAEVPALESLLAAAYKQPISIDFKDAPLKQVFEVIARTSGLNILFDRDVKVDQKTSIILKDSTIEAAIYYMLLTNQLEQQVMDANTLLIYPSNAGKQKDYQQTIVKTFLLANAKANTVADTLKTLIKMRDVVVDEKLNMIIVRDSPEAIRLAEKLIATQDVPEPEVMLEVEVLEVSRNRLTELGIIWPGSLTLTPLSVTGGAALTVADLRNLNDKTIGAAIDPVKINARGVDTDANILANPRIRVLNHEKAKIMIGNRVPSITNSVTATGVVSESVNYMDVGLKLEVEPTIYSDNDVAIRVGLEVSNVVDTQKSAQGTVTYTIGNRAANTMLRLKDGENQVLAGLINDEDRRTANKFPGLGDIPIIGRLFGSTLKDGKKSEVVLSITPRLIRNVKHPDAALSEFLSGTENSLRRRPDFTPRGVRAVPIDDVISPPQTVVPKEKQGADLSAVKSSSSADDIFNMYRRGK